jgi:hypothetical protein
LCFIDFEAAAIKDGAVQERDSFLGFLVGAHGDECESTWLPSFAIGRNCDFSDFSRCGEGRFERDLCGVIGKVADVETIAHERECAAFVRRRFGREEQTNEGRKPEASSSW